MPRRQTPTGSGKRQKDKDAILCTIVIQNNNTLRDSFKYALKANPLMIKCNRW